MQDVCGTASSSSSKCGTASSSSSSNCGTAISSRNKCGTVSSSSSKVIGAAAAVVQIRRVLVCSGKVEVVAAAVVRLKW